MTQQHTTPLVFIHGSGDSARVWKFQVEHFGAQHAIALDLPGHGQRPDTLTAEATVQQYADAVHNIVTQELQEQKPIIVGHSLGGAIALTMALEYGNEIAGIILIGTGARLRVHPTLLEDAKNSSEQARQRLSQMSVASTTAPVVLQSVEQEQAEPGRNMLYRDLAACNVFDVMQRLQEISIPTLILCGAEDQLTPVKYSTYLHQHIAGSTLHVIPDAGHYVMREQPGTVNEVIDEWLQTAFPPSTH